MKLSSDQTQINQAHLKKLNNQQKRLISVKEQEIQKVDDLYKAKKIDERVQGQTEIEDLKIQRLKESEKVNLESQERLDTHKKMLQEGIQKMDIEKDRLNKFHKDRLSSVNLFNEDKYQSFYNDAQEKTDEVRQQTSDFVKDLSSNSDNTKRQLIHQSALESKAMQSKNALTLEDQEKQHKSSVKKNDSQYKHVEELHHKEHLENVASQGRRNSIEFEQRKKIHLKKTHDKEAIHTETLKQKDEAFKLKFAAMESGHNQVLKNIKERFQNQINFLVGGLRKDKESIESKAKDPFYQISSLRLEVVEMPKDYLVQIQIPKHERDDVRLTAHDRMMTLSLTRSFSNKTQDIVGNIDKSSRSEVYSKTFNVSDILDSTKISQKYENGILTYKVAKR